MTDNTNEHTDPDWLVPGGQAILLSHSGGGFRNDRAQVVTIERLTKTQVVLKGNDVRVSRKRLNKRGSDYGPWHELVSPTDTKGLRSVTAYRARRAAEDVKTAFHAWARAIEGAPRLPDVEAARQASEELKKTIDTYLDRLPEPTT